ncbi:MAG: NAD(P)H-dependent glycerol-3-phosphate dehydrogenase [Chthoniobacterales bacterium]
MPLTQTSHSISILGAGSWGSALSLIFARAGKSVTLWGHNATHLQAIQESRLNARYLPEITFPENIHLTTSLSEAAEAGILFFVVPSKFFRAVATSLATCIDPSTTPTIISCTKGIEPTSGKLMSEILTEIIPTASIAVLSGPNLAGEIARGLPAAGVLGGHHEAALASLQNIFHQTHYRAYTSSDVSGIQLGGALKNIFAIATGASDGLGMGENARAGLVTRALAEMTRLGVSMGGRPQTFSGLSGIGDLMATCFSSQSRNYQVGWQLAQGKSPTQIEHSMTMIAEGLFTARSAQECARERGIEVPIIDEVVAVLDNGKSPREAIKGLLGRRLRSEEEGATQFFKEKLS